MCEIPETLKSASAHVFELVNQDFGDALEAFNQTAEHEGQGMPDNILGAAFSRVVTSEQEFAFVIENMSAMQEKHPHVLFLKALNNLQEEYAHARALCPDHPKLEGTASLIRVGRAITVVRDTIKNLSETHPSIPFPDFFPHLIPAVSVREIDKAGYGGKWELGQMQKLMMNDAPETDFRIRLTKFAKNNMGVLDLIYHQRILMKDPSKDMTSLTENLRKGVIKRAKKILSVMGLDPNAYEDYLPDETEWKEYERSAISR